MYTDLEIYYNYYYYHWKPAVNLNLNGAGSFQGLHFCDQWHGITEKWPNIFPIVIDYFPFSESETFYLDNLTVSLGSNCCLKYISM